MASLNLKDIYKVYPSGVVAVTDFSLDIEDKEFIVFVGPSGCGKSTTLRMIAGLEEISDGELYIDGKLMNNVQPKDRDIAMVFQNYALYPHMTVYDNMAFGLKLRKKPKEEIDEKVRGAARILGLESYLQRKPKALSGGQRQRVALGRAIVREPKVFLLDEPLSNLDAKLRVQMRTEITKLHNKLATTFIYVTHDQIEAMTMGTRIVVMKDGIMQQVDTPQFLYDSPQNLFVATFLGSPQMNLFNATLSRENGVTYATFGKNKIVISPEKANRIIDEKYFHQPVVLGIRPEDIHDEEVFIANSPDTIIEAHVDVMEKLGNETYLYMDIDGKEDYVIARIDARTKVKADEHVKLAVDSHHIHLFDPNTELTIIGVPAYNMIDANVYTRADGTVAVKFGDTDIALTDKVLSRIVDASIIDGRTIKLGISPEQLSTEAKEGFGVINGEVEFTDAYPRFNAVYTKVAGKVGFMIAKHSLEDELKSGEKITYYTDPDKLMFYDAETENALIAYSPISQNTANAKVAKNGTKCTVTFGNTKLVFEDTDNRFTPGEQKIMLDFSKFTVDKATMAANPYLIVSVIVGDADCLGDKTVVYANLAGLDTYFTAMFDGAPKLNINDRFKVAVLPEGIIPLK